MVNLTEVSKCNANKMNAIRQKLLDQGGSTPAHCRPSDMDEVRQFFWLPEDVVAES